jgi:hypothetical protein
VFEAAGTNVLLLLINSARPVADLGMEEFTSTLRPEAVHTVAATELAQQHVGRPVPNAALLGGFAALSGVVTIDAVEAAIWERFSGRVADGNAAAARAAYEAMRAQSPAVAEPAASAVEPPAPVSPAGRRLRAVCQARHGAPYASRRTRHPRVRAVRPRLRTRQADTRMITGPMACSRAPAEPAS